MRLTTILLLSTCSMLGCADKTQADDDPSESGTTETSAGSDTETETGEPEPGPYWVYSSDLQPHALAASGGGVIVGGAYLSTDPDNPDFALREADVVALDGLGQLAWAATWLSEDLPESVAALTWAPSGVYVGFEAESCGDACVESQLARLDAGGVEQWRLDPPIPAELRSAVALDDDLIVAATTSAPGSSQLIRLGPDGTQQWRWDSPPNMPAPVISDLALGEAIVWAIGSRINDMGQTVPWLGGFDPDTGALDQVLFPGLGSSNGGVAIELLDDGFVVTTPGELTALEIDGVQTWQISIPDGTCAIDVANDEVFLGCPDRLQLRDFQSMLIEQWIDLEPTSGGYVWQDVAYGERAYAGIGSRYAYVETPGKVYGIAID